MTDLTILESETKNRTERRDDKKEPDRTKDVNIGYILTELKFISEIKPGNKLCYENREMNIDSSYFPALSRWVNNYNRKETVDVLESIYTKTFKLVDVLVLNQRKNINHIQDYKNTDLLQELIKHMENSLDGLSSLKLTYNDDKHTSSRLETLIKKIGLQKQYATENIKFCVKI